MFVPRRERTSKEVASDNLLFLYLIDKANEKGMVEGQKKLMKLAFYSELSMIRNRLKGFNYNFFRYKKGPFSKEVYEDRDVLVENDVITDQGGFKLTERGKKILETLQPILERNKEFIKQIDSVVEQCAKKSPFELEKMAYEVEINGIKIIDLPMYSTIISKLYEEEADKVFEIDENYIETLYLMIDEEAFGSLTDALEKAKKSKKFFTLECTD